MKAHALRDSPMPSYAGPRKILETNPKPSRRIGLEERAGENKSDDTMKDLIGLLFYAPMLALGFNLDEPPQYADHHHRIVRVDPNIDDDDEGVGDATDEASKMMKIHPKHSTTFGTEVAGANCREIQRAAAAKSGHLGR